MKTLDFDDEVGEELTSAEKAVMLPLVQYRQFIKNNPKLGLQNPVTEFDTPEGDLLNDRTGPKPVKLKQIPKTRSILKGNLNENVHNAESSVDVNLETYSNVDSEKINLGDESPSQNNNFLNVTQNVDEAAARDNDNNLLERVEGSSTQAEVAVNDVDMSEPYHEGPREYEQRFGEPTKYTKRACRQRRTEIFNRTRRRDRNVTTNIRQGSLKFGTADCNATLAELVKAGDEFIHLKPMYDDFKGEYGEEEGYASATEADAENHTTSLGGGELGDFYGECISSKFQIAGPRPDEAGEPPSKRRLHDEDDYEGDPSSLGPDPVLDEYNKQRIDASILNAFVSNTDNVRIDSQPRRLRKRPQKKHEILVVGKRPFVDVEIARDEKIAALIDSGSTSCAITRQYLEKIIQEGVKVYVGTARYNVRSFGHDKATQDVPVVYMTIKIGCHEVKHTPFLVNSGGDPKVLLGQNFFTYKRWASIPEINGEKPYILGMRSGGKMGRIEGVRMMHTNPNFEVRLFESVTLYPKQEVWVDTYLPEIPKAKGHAFSKVAFQIEGIEEGENLVPDRMWCRLKNGNRCQIKMLNTSKTSVVLRAHDYVAQARVISDSEIEANYIALADVRKAEANVHGMPFSLRDCRCPGRGEEDWGKVIFTNRFGVGYLKAYGLLENSDRSYHQNVALLDRITTVDNDTYVQEDVYDTYFKALRMLKTDDMVKNLFPKDMYVVELAHNEHLSYQKMSVIERISKVTNVVVHRIKNVAKCKSCASIGGDDLIPYMIGVNKTCVHFSGTRDVELPEGYLTADRDSPRRTYDVMGNFVTIHRQDQKIGIYVHLQKRYFNNRFRDPSHVPRDKSHMRNAIYLILKHINQQKLTEHLEVTTDELVSETNIFGVKNEIMNALANISAFEQRKVNAKWISGPKSDAYKYPSSRIESCTCFTCSHPDNYVGKREEPISVFSGNTDNLEKGILYKNPESLSRDAGKCEGVYGLDTEPPSSKVQHELSRLRTADLLSLMLVKHRAKSRGDQEWLVTTEGGGIAQVAIYTGEEFEPVVTKEDLVVKEGPVLNSNIQNQSADVCPGHAEYIGEQSDYEQLGLGHAYKLLSEYPVSLDTDAIEQNAHRVRPWRIGIDSKDFPEEVKGRLETVLDRYEGILAHHKNEWRHLNIEPIHLEFAEGFESFVDRSHFLSIEKSKILDRKLESLLSSRMIRILDEEETKSPLLCVSAIFLAVQNSQVKLDRKLGKSIDPNVHQNTVEDRMIVDARKVNRGLKVAPASEIAFKSVQEVIAGFSGMKHCIILDIQKCYRLVPVDQESQLRLAFASPFSRRYSNSIFAFRSLVDGLRSSPSIVNQIFSDAIRDVPHCLSFLDDLVILGTTRQEVVDRFEMVCERLEKINALVSAKKIKFFPKKFEFLGFEFDLNDGNPKYGLSTERKKSYELLTMPDSLASAQAFIGTANFACYFIPGLYIVMGPLLDMLANNPGKRKIEFTPTQKIAFEKTKEAMMNAETLYVFDFTKKAVMTADASAFAYGGCLFQESPLTGKMQIVKYTSKRFPQIIQCSKNIAYKELLAQVCSFYDFYAYLGNCTGGVTMLTDSALMTYCMKTSYVALSDSLSRLIFQFWSLPVSFKIKNVPRDYLMIPDWLSKIHSNHTITGQRFYSAEEAEAYFGNAGLPTEWYDGKEFTYQGMYEHFEKIIREHDKKSSDKIKDKRLAGLKMAIDDARTNPPQYFRDNFDLICSGKEGKRFAHPVPVEECRPPIRKRGIPSVFEVNEELGEGPDAPKSSKIMSVEAESEDVPLGEPEKVAKGHFGGINPPSLLTSEITQDYLAGVQRKNEFCSYLINESRKRSPAAKAKLARKFKVLDRELVVTRHKNVGKWDYSNIRIYVPPENSFEIMAKIHLTSGHASAFLNAKTFGRNFSSNSIFHKANIISKFCLSCKLFEHPIRKNNPPGRMPWNCAVGERYYIDIVNLHKWYDIPDNGYVPDYYQKPYKNALAILDSRSNYVECVGLVTDGEGEVIKALRNSFRLLPVHPKNSTIISDNAANLCTNEKVREALKEIGFNNILNSSAHFSKTNSRIERWFRTFRRTLETNRYCYDTTNYGDVFYQSVKQINNRPLSFLSKRGALLTPHEIFYGYRSPIDITQKILDKSVITDRKKYRKDIDKILDDFDKGEQRALAKNLENFKPREALCVGDVVLKQEPSATRTDGMRNKSIPRYQKKLYIIVRMGPAGFRAKIKDVLSDSETGTMWVSKNMLKRLNDGNDINQFLSEDTIKLLGRFQSDENIREASRKGGRVHDILDRDQTSGDGPPLKQRLRSSRIHIGGGELSERLRSVGKVEEKEEEEWMDTEDTFDIDEMPADNEDDNDELNLVLEIPDMPADPDTSTEEPCDEMSNDTRDENDMAPGNGESIEDKMDEDEHSEDGDTNSDTIGNTETSSSGSKDLVTENEDGSTGETSDPETEITPNVDDTATPMEVDQSDDEDDMHGEVVWSEPEGEFPPQVEEPEAGPSSRTRAKRVTFADLAEEQPYELTTEERLSKRRKKLTLREAGLHTVAKLVRPFRKKREGLPRTNVPVNYIPKLTRPTRNRKPVKRLIEEN